MPMCIEPGNLQAGAILLAAPAAATLYVENVHVESMTPSRRHHSLRRCRSFFENETVNVIYCPNPFPSYPRAGHADAKCFFHAHHQFERVNRIKPEPIWPKKWQVIADLL